MTRWPGEAMRTAKGCGREINVRERYDDGKDNGISVYAQKHSQTHHNPG